jgi:NAD(P)-dependent dehydrogenase (short-subunit alcohol dehydrogenase family)
MEQTILVTGGTSGFGRLTVEALARQGYRVFAGMRAAAGKNALRQKHYEGSRNENGLPCTL